MKATFEPPGIFFILVTVFLAADSFLVPLYNFSLDNLVFFIHCFAIFCLYLPLFNSLVLKTLIKKNGNGSFIRYIFHQLILFLQTDIFYFFVSLVIFLLTMKI